MMMRTFLFVTLSLSLGLLHTCNSDASRSTQEEADQLWTELSPGWNEISPGGETICSQGTPYTFFFHPGSREKLLVFFQGGGACWNEVNCDLNNQPTYDPNIDSTDNPASTPMRFQGIFEKDVAGNPVRDYSILMIPYCSADTHLGNNNQTYIAGDSSFVIRHRGFANSMAALDWVYDRIPEPDIIFVTGESAGSVASPFYAGILADRYAKTRITQLGDCSGAYGSVEFSPILERWGAYEVMMAAGIAEPAELTSLTEATLEIAQRHPNVTFSQYNSAFDEAQQFFLAQLGGTPDSILTLLQHNMTLLDQNLPNFRYYIDTGNHHTILSHPQFYSTGVPGTPLSEWVTELEGEDGPESVYCEPCD